MKKKMVVLLILTAFAALTAQGNKPAGAETVSEGMTFALDSVESVEVSSEWEITLEEGPRAVLEIEETPDRQGWMNYDGKNLQLGVESRSGIRIRMRPRRATLTLPHLPGDLRSSSGSKILVSMDGDVEDLSLRVSSSGNISLSSLTAGELIVDISSSGEVKLERIRTSRLNVDLSSSAELSIEQGETEELEAKLSSSAEFKGGGVTVTGSLMMNASSSSEMEIGLGDGADTQGSMSSSSRLIIHGDPKASRLQDIRLSSSASIDIRP